MVNKKTEEHVEPEKSPGPEPVEEETSAGLTNRQRTRVEKTLAAVAEQPDDTSKCANHPDRDSVIVTDGVLTSVQAFCAECATRNGFALPSPE